MNPLIAVYLSEDMATRLEAAAQRSGVTSSALIEAALDLFLDSNDDVGDTDTVSRRLTALSRQLEHLDRDLRIVNETVALHARFHLAVTPTVPVETQRAACLLGAERFEEFAAQVGQRVDLGVPLMRTTMQRLRTARPDRFPNDVSQAHSPDKTSTVSEPGLRASATVDDASLHTAAVREDGSSGGFPGWTGCRLH